MLYKDGEEISGWGRKTIRNGELGMRKLLHQQFCPNS
jgi:hypothetical protein